MKEDTLNSDPRFSNIEFNTKDIQSDFDNIFVLCMFGSLDKCDNWYISLSKHTDILSLRLDESDTDSSHLLKLIDLLDDIELRAVKQ